MKNNLKAVSKNENELRVANYIVLFGGTDLAGETFTKDTDFESSYTKTGVLHVDFEHGLDPDNTGMNEDEVLGYVDWKTMKVDDTGVFVERVLNRQAAYMEYIEPLIDAGIVGNSSEAVAGKTHREGSNIVQWPLKRDTLTVQPCEPRMMGENAIQAMKSLGFNVQKTDIKNVKTLKEVESVLREKGFSQTEATAIVAAVKNIHGERENEEEKEVLKIFKNFNLKIGE